MYKLTANGVIKRLEDGASIPDDPKNKDYQKYLDWVDLGNTPEQEIFADVIDSFIDFSDKFLGRHTTHPVEDNEGGALSAGLIYFNTLTQSTKYYDGVSWKNLVPGELVSFALFSGDNSTKNFYLNSLTFHSPDAIAVTVSDDVLVFQEQYSNRSDELIFVTAPAIGVDNVLVFWRIADAPLSASIDSPNFRGNPTAPTLTPGDVSDNIATTGFADNLKNGIVTVDIEDFTPLAPLTLGDYEAGHGIIILTGELSEDKDIYFPNGRSGQWIVHNRFTGNRNVRIRYDDELSILELPNESVTAVYGNGEKFNFVTKGHIDGGFF